MGTWHIGERSYEVDTHGNMRQFVDIHSGRIYLVRVEVFAKSNGKFIVEVLVDGLSVSCMEWVPFIGGKMRQNQLPETWGLSTGFDIGWRYIQKQEKVSV